MKFPQTNSFLDLLTAKLVVFTVVLTALAVGSFGQKLTFTKDLAPESISTLYQQCANGPATAPMPCNVSTGNDGYGRGNLVASKSHYKEGDSVPIRLVMTGLDVGSTYTVTFGYDLTKGGKYAVDYLTNYDRTESVSNDPCVGVSGCTLASRQNFPIPVDPQVTAGYNGVPGGGDDIVQIPGNFSCFGCTITAVSGYSFTGSTSGDSHKSITVTFTASQANAVIAYGAHISTRLDWGVDHSAISISGSPYHDSIDALTGGQFNNGDRDLQFGADAITYPAQIIIKKLVTTNSMPPTYDSTFSFFFMVTAGSANYGASSFNLVDNNPLQFEGGVRDTMATIVNFGATNAIDIQESQYLSRWTLADLSCTEVGGGIAPVINTTWNQSTRTVHIVPDEAEIITCTYSNLELANPTAAQASISGRVVNSSGFGVKGATVSVLDVSTNELRFARTNGFGYYTIDGLDTASFYAVSVSAKGYVFNSDVQYFTLNDSLANVDFIANP